MKLSKVKAMAFSLRQEIVDRMAVEALLARGVNREGCDQDWLQALDRIYMCCEHVPLAEMESEDPGETAEWFIRQSRKQHWQQRQMRPLGHLDIIAVGESLYMIYDKFTDEVDDYCELPLFNTPDFTLITIKDS